MKKNSKKRYLKSESEIEKNSNFIVPVHVDH